MDSSSKSVKSSMNFSLKSKSQSNRPKRPSSFAGAAEPSTSTAGDSSTKTYVSEFNANEAVPTESKIKPIAPIPDDWRRNKKLKNLESLPSLAEEASLQFELDTGSNPEPTDDSIGFGLNLRQPAAGGVNGGGKTVSDLELLREDLKKLPEDTGMDEFEDVPVESFAAALLSGYGWKEGQGIGRNKKEDTKVTELTRKMDRGGLGFTGEMPKDQAVVANGNAGGNIGNTNVGQTKTDIGQRKTDNGAEKKGLREGKEVRIVSGREMGMKGKIVELRSGGDVLVLRILKTGDKVKVRPRDVAEVGSVEEEKCLRKLKESKVKERDTNKDNRDRKPSSKKSLEKEKAGSESVNWLRNHIRVRIVSKELKGGRLFLKKGMVVDVVGPGVCDISIDESRELVQGVDQEMLETALPKRGGPVLVLYGKHKGVYGSLLERDSEKETGLVRDADTHELLNVKLEQIAEFAGDPSDIGY